MERKGKYIYGIIPNVVTQSGYASGSRSSTEAFTTFGINSNSKKAYDCCWNIANEEIYTISYQDISALVRDSDIVDYTRMRKDILARLLVDHQTVIERIMATQDTIIPMRLGTYALDETEVKEILNKGYNLIKHILEKVRDKIEIDVAATWSNFNVMMKEAGEEREVKEFKERLLANPKGITVDDQMRIGFMLKKVLDDRREEFARRMLERLRDLSEDTRTHELMDDNMVLNSAFLINKAKHKDFEIRVEELNIEFAEKLNFRCVGPLPPYSFYTLEIKKLRFEEIDWARKKLKLFNNSVTRDEIKKAHQSLAFSSHPDQNPNTPGIEKEFDEATKAYKVLWEYCLSAEQAGQKDPCSFKEDEFKKNAILVKVRG